MKTIIHFLIALVFLTGCHGQNNFPTTEKDCLKEVNFLINKFKAGQFDSVALVINKYPDIHKYTASDLKTGYDTLTNYLNQKNAAKYYFKYGDEKLTDSNIEGIITSEFAIYYCRQDSIEEKRLCAFKYAFVDNRFQLRFMFHNLHIKRKVILPPIPK